MPRSIPRTPLLGAIAALLTCATLSQGIALAFDHPFIGRFSTVTSVASTVPSNGDENPYGIVTVPASVGSLTRGALLSSTIRQPAWAVADMPLDVGRLPTTT